MRITLPILLPLLSVLLAVGCGPIRSTIGLVDAERALREAHEAGAMERAPYQTEIAEELLAKAKEAAGRSTYDKSMYLANEATTWANQARDVARGLAPPESTAPVDPLPELGPEPGAGESTPEEEATPEEGAPAEEAPASDPASPWDTPSPDPEGEDDAK